MRVFTKIFHGVADAVDYAGHDPAVVYFRLRGNLAANDDLARCSEDLHGDAGIGVLPEMRVQNGVRHLIAELVGMTGADGFRRDQSGVFLVHDDSPVISRNGRPASEGGDFSRPSPCVSVWRAS
jgi:hypothetical protein